MGRAREHELKQAGITTTQSAILHLLKVLNGPVTPPMLSVWLFREPHTITMILGRMEKQGLIRKTKDLPIKNVVRVTLTEKGEEAYTQSSKTRAIRNILSCLSPEERDTLREYMERLRGKAIEEYQEGPQWRFP
jgi:DNA-binding MarR family transcriptional regulator